MCILYIFCLFFIVLSPFIIITIIDSLKKKIYLKKYLSYIISSINYHYYNEESKQKFVEEHKKMFDELSKKQTNKKTIVDLIIIGLHANEISRCIEILNNLPYNITDDEVKIEIMLLKHELQHRFYLSQMKKTNELS